MCPTSFLSAGNNLLICSVCFCFRNWTAREISKQAILRHFEKVFLFRPLFDSQSDYRLAKSFYLIIKLNKCLNNELSGIGTIQCDQSDHMTDSEQLSVFLSKHVLVYCMLHLY